MIETLSPSLPKIEMGEAESSYKIGDEVRMHFLYQKQNESTWVDPDYGVDAVVVGGPQSSGEPDAPFKPYLLTSIPLPENDPYASGHPFAMSEEPFSGQLRDGSPVLIRYLVIVRQDVITW